MTQGSPFVDDAGVILRAEGGGDLLALSADEVREAFVRSGFVFFQGFHLDLGVFREFTSRFTRHFVTEYNPLERHYLGDGTMTVQYYREGVPLHGEMAYLPRISPHIAPPDILWFYCARPAREQGETLVCDGVRVAKELTGSTRRLFREKRLRYQLVTSPEVWQAAAGVREPGEAEKILRQIPGVVSWKFEPSGLLRWEYATHAIRRIRFGDEEAFVNSIVCIRPPLEDGSAIPEEVVAEILAVTARLTVPVMWKGGELLMLDNSRYLHGRVSNDDQRLIYVRMSLADF